MPGRRAFLRRRHVAAAATRQVIIDVIEARRARLGVMRRWRPSARASRPRSDSGRRQVIPVRGGTEPLAGRSGACAARAAAATAPLCEPQSPAHSGSGRSEPRPSPETLGPPKLEPSPARQHQAPTGAGQRGRGALAVLVQRAGVDQNMTPAAVTAATAKTSLQITCPRRGPEPAAITAKTARMGLEITAGRRAVIKCPSCRWLTWAVPVTTWLQPRRAVYLYIAALEATVRFCRVPLGAPRCWGVAWMGVSWCAASVVIVW